MPIQNSAKGYLSKQRIDATTTFAIGTLTLTDDATNTVFSGGIKISSAQGITGNSTGLVFANPVSSLPGNVDGGVQIGVGSNSTGVFLAINTSGTTWKYLNVTTKQPT